MISGEMDDASADEAALLNAMHATFLPSSAPLARREAREKSKASPKRQAGARAPRKGGDRTAQCNIKMLPAVKARMTAYCARQGIAVTDWLEEVILQLPEG